jgi:hypothetical protein
MASIKLKDAMTDLSQYKYFKEFKSPMMDYIKDNYESLKQDFYTNISHSQLMANKPAYTFADGVTELYRGKILSAGLKNANIALDDDERRIMRWQPHEEYRHNWLRCTPELQGPWVDFVKRFDNQLEQMFFNIAYPGAAITPHKGIHTRYFRVHICLQTNPGFVFDIAGERKYWYEGVDHAFAFDDGNLRHGVYYEERGQSQPRIVAILDVKKEYYPEMFGL